MGRPKALLPWGGTTLIAWQVAQLLEAGLDDVVVVLGHEPETVRPALASSQARIVVNEDHRVGRASSLRCGAQAVADDTTAVLVANLDQPRPSWLTRLLLERWQRDHPAIVWPRFGGHRGHPVLLDGRLLPELRQVEEAGLGLRAVLERHTDEGTFIEVDNLELNVDLNTQTQYEAALGSFQAGRWRQ
jgi:molybdenum cofactor cytidylyltransferase